MLKHLLFFTLLVFVCGNIAAQNVLDCIPVVKTVNNQINQVVVSANSGSAIIAWQDGRSGNYDIYAQRVSDDGHMQWLDHITGKLEISDPSEQINLSMVSDGSGGAFIAWQDNRNVNWDIYATRIDANGDIYPGWGVTGMAICTDTSDQSAPKLVSVGSAGAFITWSDNRGGDYDIYTMRIQLDGTLTGNVNGTRMQLLPESGNQVNPDICIDGAGGALLAYEQYTGPGDYDIYAQRIDSSCMNMWADGGVPACIANNNQRNPKLANDSVGSAIIVWEDNVNFTWDLYAQRVFSGAIQWTANGVAIMAIALDQINPVIVSAGQYEAIIVWEHYLSGTDSNIYAQKIWGGAGGTNGTLQWLATGVPVSTIQDSYQMHPQAVSDGAGGAIIVFETGENIGANGYDVYGQHLDAAGNPSAVGGYPICTWDTDQTIPMLAYSNTATNNAIYAWWDKRNEPEVGIHDIYTLGVEEEYTYTVTSHDVNNPGGPDLNAEILFNGLPFATPIYTGYIFGAPGNLPFLPGTYSVVLECWDYWIPESVTFDVINNNYSTDFLAIWICGQVPVELSSFTANQTAQNFVQLTWVSQTENQMSGYLVYRNTSTEQSSSTMISSVMIPATNTSTTQSYSITDNDVEIGNTYYYWLEAIDYSSSTYHGPVSINVEGIVPPMLPEITTMSTAYPNPFKTDESTMIQVALKAGETGTISIYNIIGQVVKTYSVSEGIHSVTWNGRDSNDQACGSGVYFYRLSTPSISQTKRMVIIK